MLWLMDRNVLIVLAGLVLWRTYLYKTCTDWHNTLRFLRSLAHSMDESNLSIIIGENHKILNESFKSIGESLEVFKI